MPWDRSADLRVCCIADFQVGRLLFRFLQTGLSGDSSFQVPPLRERDAWYFWSVSTKSVQALKRAEGRQRMADLRHARSSRRTALAFERRYALTYGMRGRITNLRQMLEAMAH